jgi:hypothetical protein
VSFAVITLCVASQRVFVVVVVVVYFVMTQSGNFSTHLRSGLKWVQMKEAMAYFTILSRNVPLEPQHTEIRAGRAVHFLFNNVTCVWFLFCDTEQVSSAATL